MTSDPTFDLRIADAITALAVHRHGSVTSAARELRVTASQVSKALTRIERNVGTRLFVRRGRGLMLTEPGLRVLPRLRAIVDNARALFEGEHTARVTVAAPSYLCQAYLPLIARAVQPNLLRGLEGLPSYVRSHASDGLFQMALATSEDKLPPSWARFRVGVIRFAVFVPPSIAQKLGKSTSVSDFRPIPFVTPIYASGDDVVAGDDRFPIPRSERTQGHEASTIYAALELAAEMGQAVCGPVVAAKRWLDTNRLVEVRVDDWDLQDPLFLTLDTDEITSRTKTRLLTAFEEAAKTAP